MITNQLLAQTLSARNNDTLRQASLSEREADTGTTIRILRKVLESVLSYSSKVTTQQRSHDLIPYLITYSQLHHIALHQLHHRPRIVRDIKPLLVSEKAVKGTLHPRVHVRLIKMLFHEVVHSRLQITGSATSIRGRESRRVQRARLESRHNLLHNIVSELIGSSLSHLTAQTRQAKRQIRDRISKNLEAERGNTTTHLAVP